MLPGTAGVTAATGGADPTSVGPGLAGFLAIFAITLATWVLFRSMNKHLRTVRHSPDPAAGQAAGDGPAGRRDAPADDVRGAPDAGGDDGGAGPFHEEPPGGRPR